MTERGMAVASENGKELSHSAQANGMKIYIYIYIYKILVAYYSANK